MSPGQSGYLNVDEVSDPAGYTGGDLGDPDRGWVSDSAQSAMGMVVVDIGGCVGVSMWVEHRPSCNYS
ncbi:MAG: hypothetical protein M3291_03785 [Actinomycetota bacterium]|nr:hypothetical protein [Actinomycetota bacterium]